MAVKSHSLRSEEADSVINKASKTRVKKTKHGARGESFILKTLKAQGKKVLHASKTNNRLGYDIAESAAHGKQIFHEVKSSAKEKFAPSIWYIAKKQYQMAMSNLQNYYYWFINSVNSKNPTVEKLKPEQLEFRPGRYQITVGSDYKPYFDMTFKAQKLLEELDSSYKLPRKASMREEKPELEERQLIAQAVLTRKFLAERLESSKRQGIKSLDYNLDRVSTKKPYHLKYTNAQGLSVYVDLKVSLDDSRGFTRDSSFRFHITKNRLEKALKLNAKSDHRREFWYCHLDSITKELKVRAYDVSGKRFWQSPKNYAEVDYYSFKVIN